MVPAAREEEIKTLVVQQSESDMASAQGTSRKYASAIALLALVAVAGVGMHRHFVQSNGTSPEIGDIIEACADYTVQASCSAASCVWNSASVQCEEAAHRAIDNQPYVVAAEREETSTNTTAPTPAPPNTQNADGTVTMQLCAPIPSTYVTEITLCDGQYVGVGVKLIIGTYTVTITGIKGSRRLSGEGRRLNNIVTVFINPGMQGPFTVNTKILAMLLATPAPTTPCTGSVTPKCNAFGTTATLDLGEQFSCATQGKPETQMESICAIFKANCLQASDAAWLNGRPRCNGMIPRHDGSLDAIGTR